MMKTFLIAIIIGLTFVMLIQGVTVRNQQRVIRLMSTNPFCMEAQP